jgi:NDP-sugar pyrophosphorylase family protein
LSAANERVAKAEGKLRALTDSAAAGKTVVSFPILEYWLDIGQPEDFQRAQDDIRNDPRASARKRATAKRDADERAEEK